MDDARATCLQQRHIVCAVYAPSIREPFEVRNGVHDETTTKAERLLSQPTMTFEGAACRTIASLHTDYLLGVDSAVELRHYVISCTSSFCVPHIFHLVDITHCGKKSDSQSATRLHPFHE